MSFAKDVLGFERFHLRDLGKKIKKDPLRMALGAVDPASTKLWNHTGVGKDWEPLVDQMGGAYGGKTLTLGDTGEGVYGRATEAGVPTKAGAGMHDIAHVIASMFAGGYGADKLGSVGGIGKFADKMPAGMKGLGGFGFGGGSPAPQARRMPELQQPVPFVAASQGPAVSSKRTGMTRNQLMAEMLRRV